MTNIYLLKREERGDYDEYCGHVIKANDEQSARNLAERGDEGDIWKDETKTTCILIGTGIDDIEELILSDYNAG